MLAQWTIRVNLTGNAQTAEVPGGGWTRSSCHADFSALSEPALRTLDDVTAKWMAGPCARLLGSILACRFKAAHDQPLALREDESRNSQLQLCRACPFASFDMHGASRPA